jgi:hypothetical protein
MDTGYYIYDFERGRFWNQNKHGYSENITDLTVGNFDYEDALKIVKSSNLVRIESEMIHATDIDRLKSIKSEIGTKEKINAKEIFEKITKEYYPNNPFSKITDALENNGHYIEDEPNVRPLYNGENQRFELFFENSKEGFNVVITRLGTGNYEVIGNTITRDEKHLRDLLIINYSKDFVIMATSHIDDFVNDMITKENCKDIKDISSHVNFLGKQFLESCTYKMLDKHGDNHMKGLSANNKFLLKKAAIEKNGFKIRFKDEIDKLFKIDNTNKLKK